MVTILIPAEEKNFAAEYNDGLLTVFFNGEVDAFLLNPRIERERAFVGGLSFLFEATVGGPGPEEKQEMVHKEISHSERIRLPIPHFNSKTIGVVTATGNYQIPIRYLGYRSDIGTGTETSLTLGSVATPIDIFIRASIPPLGAPIPITAQLPRGREQNWFLTIDLDEEYLRIYRTVTQNDTMTWYIGWEKIPKDDTPKSIDVKTVPQLSGSGMIGLIQPYNVYKAPILKE